MLNITQNFNFSHELGHETLRRDCFLLDSFQANNHPSRFMEGDGDFTKLALAYVFNNFKIVKNRIVPQIIQVVFRFYRNRFLYLIRFSIGISTP